MWAMLIHKRLKKYRRDYTDKFLHDVLYQQARQIEPLFNIIGSVDELGRLLPSYFPSQVSQGMRRPTRHSILNRAAKRVASQLKAKHKATVRMPFNGVYLPKIRGTKRAYQV